MPPLLIARQYVPVKNGQGSHKKPTQRIKSEAGNSTNVQCPPPMPPKWLETANRS